MFMYDDNDVLDIVEQLLLDDGIDDDNDIHIVQDMIDDEVEVLM